MNVMYTCDDNYVWLMGISTISLFENNKTIEDLQVYLLGDNISQENKDKLKKIGDQYGRKIQVIEIPPLTIPTALISARWPLAAFTRLFSGGILPVNVDKILYLDCDTIVSGDISELEKVSFNGNIVMGVKDCISRTYKKNIGLDNNSLYINAGVLLLDVDELRKININKKIDEYMQQYVEFINYADQDILNGVFKNCIGELSPKFNVMTLNVVHTYAQMEQLRRPTNYYNYKEWEEAKNNPAIIHYTTNMLVVRPWYSNANHPLRGIFKKYMEMSVWKDKQLTEMVFNSPKDRVIRILTKLPDKWAYRALGIIHAELKPRYIKMRARK